jgi:hypothetical protein
VIWLEHWSIQERKVLRVEQEEDVKKLAGGVGDSLSMGMMKAGSTKEWEQVLLPQFPFDDKRVQQKRAQSRSHPLRLLHQKEVEIDKKRMNFHRRGRILLRDPLLAKQVQNAMKERDL